MGSKVEVNFGKTGYPPAATGAVAFIPSHPGVELGTAETTGWLGAGQQLYEDATETGMVELAVPESGAVSYDVVAYLKDGDGVMLEGQPVQRLTVQAGAGSVTLQDVPLLVLAGETVTTQTYARPSWASKPVEAPAPAPVPVKGERGEPGPKGDRGGLDAEAAALVQRLASGAAPRDTGWRRVESPAIADGALFYRRVGDWCIIAARGGVWDTITVHDRPDIPDTNYRDVGEKIRLSLTTPAGWQPDQPVLAPVVTDTGEPRGIIILHSRGDGNRITWRRGTLDLSPQNRSNLRCGLLIYPATDPFPTALPGTPA